MRYNGIINTARIPGLVILYCLLSLSGTGILAQESGTFKALYAGVIGGAGYSLTLFDPGVPGDAGAVSPVFGLAFRFESPERKAIEMEVRYRQGGWSEFDVYERKMQILEFPIMGNIAIGKGKYKPFITLGETITYILSEEETLTNPDYTPIFYNKPVNNKWGFALNGGLGIMRNAGKGVIQLEARATFQVTNIYNPSDEEIRELGLSSSFPLFFEGNLKYLFRIK